MKIFMVRHGQTDSNAAKRIMGQGVVDESLNAEGIRQVKELAESIQGMSFDSIFSSPLKRAAETARIIAQGRSVSVILRDELKERDFGSLSGKTWPEADAFAKKEAGALRAEDIGQAYNYRPFGGESGEDVKNRLLKFVAEIKETHADKKVLVVAHSGIMRLSHLLFRETEVGHIQNASIEEFEI